MIEASEDSGRSIGIARDSGAILQAPLGLTCIAW